MGGGAISPVLGGVWFSLSCLWLASDFLSPLEDLGLDSSAERLVEDFDFFIALSSFSDFFLGDFALFSSIEILDREGPAMLMCLL